MFGRRQETPVEESVDTEPTAASTPSAVSTARTGKGRPTPSRREQEALNKRPLVQKNRKVAKTVSREKARSQRMTDRQAMLRGEAVFPRDKGPVRQYARDVVDARRNFGEWFLPLALLVVVVGFVPVRGTQLVTMAVLYLIIVLCIFDGILLRRRLKRELFAHFGEDRSKGAVMYGVLRAYQLRRSRMPAPVVKRGEPPRG